MSFLPMSVLRHALLRSRLRGDGLLGLEDLGEASIVDLARALRADVGNLRGAFQGDRGRYKVRASLVFLGLVESRVVRGVRLFRLTPAGRWAASWWRAERDRAKVAVPLVGVT